MLLRNSMEGKFAMTLGGLMIFLDKLAIAIHFQADLRGGLLHNSFENDQDEI